MMEFTEKELFCLARHIIAQHYEETYPLTYLSNYNGYLEHYKKEKEEKKKDSFAKKSQTYTYFVPLLPFSYY